MTGLEDRNLILLKVKAANTPASTPIPSETIRFKKKLPRMMKEVLNLKSYEDWEMSKTALNRMIETASLTIPSPKITEKSFGNQLLFIRVKAATESVAQIVDANNRIVFVQSLIYNPSRSYIRPIQRIAIVNKAMTEKETRVPTSPQSEMQKKFLKNFRFLRLNPPAKIIRGRIPQKNSS